MNIAFDATAILGAMGKNRGIGDYALNQFRNMILNDSENEYYFFNCFESYTLFKEDNTPKNIHEDYFYCGDNATLITDERYADFYGNLVKTYISKNNIDVFYITSPFDNCVPIYQKEWFEDVKVVVTVYDIIPYIMKEKYLPNKEIFSDYIERVNQLKWCDRIFTISDSVKKDLVQELNFQPNKIVCIMGGVNPKYKKIDVTDKQREELNKKYGITGPFIMCTGGDDERKNIEGLIKAYSLLSNRIKEKYQLVVVCKLSEATIDRLNKLAKSQNVLKRLVLTNFVPFYDLLVLYNAANLMAFPSKYEGFGLPVVEAFACGTPVLTSNNSSLIEIAGDAAYIVDPFDVKSIARQLEVALTDENIDSMGEKGFQRAKLFQWEHIANYCVANINELEGQKNEKEIKEEKEKIAFFSPLPPARSGISDYSVDILNEISKYFDITAFIDDGYKCDLAFNNISVCNHKEFRVENFAHIVYQYGNSSFHNYMNDYIKKYGGILVLHDYNLHELVSFNAFHSHFISFNDYLQILHEDYSDEFIENYLEDCKISGYGYDAINIPVNGFLTNHVDKIIVHSDENRKKLLKKNIGQNVKTIRSYGKPLPQSSNGQTKGNADANGKITIAAFGHVHEFKRIFPILKALGKLKAKFTNFKMVFCGKLVDGSADKFNNLVKELELEDYVTVTGYVDMDDFLKYLDKTDICLNFRYPYNGETSGSLMRILAAKKCVLVNAIGSFAEIPDDCCIKLPSVSDMTDEEEVQVICNKLEMLFKDPNIIASYGKKAGEYADEFLNIEVIGKEYKRFIESKPNNYIQENLVKKIREYEIIEKNYTKKQILALSRTLAYFKNDNDFKM